MTVGRCNDDDKIRIVHDDTTGMMIVEVEEKHQHGRRIIIERTMEQHQEFRLLVSRRSWHH